MKNRLGVATLAVGILTTAWLVSTGLRSTQPRTRVGSHDGGPSPRPLRGDTNLFSDNPPGATGSGDEVGALKTSVVAPRGDVRDALEDQGTAPQGRPPRLRSSGLDRPPRVTSSISTRTATPPSKPSPLSSSVRTDSTREKQLEETRHRRCVTLADHVQAGLAWLALHQSPDGHFSEAACRARCQELGHTPTCAGPPRRGQRIISTTGLALIAFCGFRNHDKKGQFEPSLAGAARWLQGHQQSDGSFVHIGNEDVPYRTAIALTSLGLVAASSGDTKLRAAVHLGMARLAANRLHGANRDLSTLACVAQAIEAARSAGVEVPPALIQQMRTYLAKYWVENDRFLQRSTPFVNRARPSPVGMLASWILWDELDSAVVQAWRTWLVTPSAAPHRSPYSVFHGVRMTVLLEEPLPRVWRDSLLEIATEQSRGESRAGSFPDLGSEWWMGPTTPETTFQTAAAVLALEHGLLAKDLAVRGKGAGSSDVHPVAGRR